MTFIDLTAYNALTDDDGSNTIGSPWNKAQIASVILTPIESAFAANVGTFTQTTTSTGTQNDFSLTTGTRFLRCNNGSLLTITGLTAAATDQALVITSIGSGNVTLSNQAVGSSTSNRIITGESASITLGAGIDSVMLVYDGTTARWRVVLPRPKLRSVVYHNTTQSLADNTLTALTMNSEDTDPSAMHDTVTNNSRITIPAGGDGTYLVIGSSSFAANATGNRQLVVYKNGSPIQYQVKTAATAAVADAFQVSYMGNAVAGDYFEVWAYQNSGGVLNAGSATRAIGSSISAVRL